MPAMGHDAQLRSAAFQRVRELEARFGDSIPWTAIDEGFLLNGERIHLVTRPKGIFWPRQMHRGVLSIRTTAPRRGRERRYDDIASDDGFFEYRFRGEDAQHGDNRALRESWEDQTPLIYFHAVVPTVYQAIWPAFITAGTRSSFLCVSCPASASVAKSFYRLRLIPAVISPWKPSAVCTRPSSANWCSMPTKGDARSADCPSGDYSTPRTSCLTATSGDYP